MNTDYSLAVYYSWLAAAARHDAEGRPDEAARCMRAAENWADIRAARIATERTAVAP